MKIMMNFIKDINPCYLILNFLLLIAFYYYLKSKQISKPQKRIILSITLLISLGIFSYGNDFVQNIFALKYLSVKFYLIIVIMTNIITLYTFNKKLSLRYSTLNYTLFILIMIIFGSIAAIVIGNKFENLYIMDISNAITLMDLSLVTFILYLIIALIIYIGSQLFSEYSLTKVENSRVITENQLFEKEKKLLQKWKQKILLLITKKTKEKQSPNQKSTILSSEELLNYPDKHNFYINGVDCSIIFEDSNSENIIKNYHILLKDIEAKLVNGYTLKENQLLRSICMKLRVSNLNYIDIHNTNLLNRISLEEYNFLKNIIETH